MPSFEFQRDDLIHRIRGEYLEMPGLSLRLEQAQRLWGLERTDCQELLGRLVRSQFLYQRRDGAFARLPSSV
jgi:hypothetical protein